MSRYIDLDEAKARTTQLIHGYEVEQWLDTIPSIDIDRVQGEWIKDAEWWCVYKCSVCGETFDELTNYCPNCGARMKGADDE